MFKRLKTLFKKQSVPQLPVLLDVAEFERLMPSVGAFPRPEWATIQKRIESEFNDQLNQAWQDFAHIWLTRLSYRLEQGYRVQRSREFILLSTLNERRSGFVLQTLENMRERILNTLGWSRQSGSHGLYTVLLFSDSTTYFQYVADFGPEGEEPGSVGQFLTGAYGHMAVIEQEIWRVESTLAYLLTHYILSECHLPWWLQHGLCNYFSNIYDQGDHGLQVNLLASWIHEASDFWSVERIRALWDGTILLSEDKEKAEKFAFLLTRAVLQAVENVPNFLQKVSWEDAGDGAVLQETGQPLSQFVEGILGPGDWAPPPLTDSHPV